MMRSLRGIFAARDRRGAMSNNSLKNSPAAFEESLYNLSQRTRLNRDVVARYAVLFAEAHATEFAAFVSDKSPPTVGKRRWRPKFDLNILAFLMFVLGMILSIAVMMTRT